MGDVATLLRRLRKKSRTTPSALRHLQTVRGFGYRVAP